METEKEKVTSKTVHMDEECGPNDLKYKFDLPTDPLQDDRATQIKLLSFARPHMRAFHLNWITFFFAFFSWFAIAPLMPIIKKSLNLQTQQVNISNLVGLTGAVFMRFLVGPLCEVYGPRKVQMFVLILFSIPTYLVGTVRSYEGLLCVRFFIGCIGSSFVTCQYWSSKMFAKNVYGRANALVGGWGNLGGGVTQMFMGSAMYPIFYFFFFEKNSELAWRSVFVVPATMTIIAALIMYRYSDDCPYGNYDDMKPEDRPQLSGGNSVTAFLKAIQNPNTVIVMVAYGSCFGVELVFDNIATTYYNSAPFKLDLSTAAITAASFGFTNIFARALGGYLSDFAAEYMNMRGRIMLVLGLQLFSAMLIMLFTQQLVLGPSIACLIFLSIFVQAGCGAVFGIVPYIDPQNLGATSGAVGAGGNIGAILWTLVTIYYQDASSIRNSLSVIGICIFCSTVLYLFINIPGHAGLLFGVEDESLQVSNHTMHTGREVKVKSQQLPELGSNTISTAQ